LTLRTSLVENNHDAGLLVGGSDATVEATVVRGTLPSANANGGGGGGIVGLVQPGTKARANVTLRAGLLEPNHEVGVVVSGSDATVEATVVRGTLPGADGMGGRGFEVDDDSFTNERSNVTLRACLVEQNQEVGVAIAGSDATVEATVVRDTVEDA